MLRILGRACPCQTNFPNLGNFSQDKSNIGLWAAVDPALSGKADVEVLRTLFPRLAFWRSPLDDLRA